MHAGTRKRKPFWIEKGKKVSGCAGVDVQQVSIYAICVEGYLRGRHPLRSSCTLKMGTMKARVEVRRLRTVALHAMYDTVHRALINRYTHSGFLDCCIIA